MHSTADSIALRTSDFYSTHDIELVLGKEVRRVPHWFIKTHL